jgi:hypothetical protein
MPSYDSVVGQIVLILAAILGAGGGLRYLVEPYLTQRRLQKVIATGLWLSCYELRCHLEAIQAKLAQDNSKADQTRDALLKIPKNDYGGRPDWFVKTGYFCMITAYKIAAFSSWMRIYQTSVLQAVLAVHSDHFVTELFRRFDEYKAAASRDSVFWYSYIEAIGEKVICTEGGLNRPLSFSEFCKKYHEDREFLYYFDQLHMFIHFMGRKGQPWKDNYQVILGNMIMSLGKVEELTGIRKENILQNFKLADRTRTTPAELSEYIKE